MKYNLDVVTSNKSRWLNSKTFIMLHHTWTVTSLENMVSYLSKKNERQVSCHFVISRDGRIGRIGNENDILWHAGTGNKIQGFINNMNAHAIGIEVISNWNDYTRKQIEVLSKLVFFLQTKFWIKNDNVIRHKDYSIRKWDIGDNFYKIFWYKDYNHWLNRMDRITSYKWVPVINKKQPSKYPLRLWMFHPYKKHIILYDRAYRLPLDRFKLLLEHEWSHKVYWTEFTKREIQAWEQISRLDDIVKDRIKNRWTNVYWVNKYISPGETIESEDFAETYEDIIKNPNSIYNDYRDIKRMAVRKLMAIHWYVI